MFAYQFRRKYTTKQKRGYNKRHRGSREILSRIYCFYLIDSTTEQQQILSRPIDNKRKNRYYYSGKKKRHTIKNQLTVNNRGYILHKVAHKKGKRHMITISTKRTILRHSKEVVTVVDLGYLGMEKDFPEQLYLPYHSKRKETSVYHKKKKITTLFIQK